MVHVLCTQRNFKLRSGKKSIRKLFKNRTINPQSHLLSMTKESKYLIHTAVKFDNISRHLNDITGIFPETVQNLSV